MTFRVCSAASSDARPASQADALERAVAGLVDDEGRLRVGSPVVAAQVFRNAQARRDLAVEFPLLTAAEVAAASASTAKNAHATAARWQAQGEVFAVPDSGVTVYPSFQFNEHGRPLPAVAQTLDALAGAISGWQLALWFTTSLSRLGGRRPVDVLDSDDPTDQRLLLEAAKAQAADILNPAW